MTSLTIAAVVASTLLLVACSKATTTTTPPQPASVGRRMEAPGGSYTLITVNELQGMLKNKDFVLVNVHVPYAGEIEKTDMHITYNEIDKNLGKLPAKGAKIVLYCRAGPMSTEAAQSLVKLGYTSVYDVEGGMNAWEAAGYPLKR